MPFVLSSARRRCLMNYVFEPIDYNLIFGLLFGFYTCINLMQIVSYAFRRFDN